MLQTFGTGVVVVPAVSSRSVTVNQSNSRMSGQTVWYQKVRWLWPAGRVKLCTRVDVLVGWDEPSCAALKPLRTGSEVVEVTPGAGQPGGPGWKGPLAAAPLTGAPA